MRITMAVAGAGLMACLAGAAAAQAPKQGDRQFLDEATSSGQTEITAGQLAQKQGSPGVRVFGRWMVTDHTLVGNLLADRAKEMGIALPGESVQAVTTGPDLASLHDKDFDAPYLKQQVADHQKAIALFERESASGTDAALQRIAQLALPAIREHLAVAQQLSTAAQ